MRLVLALAPLLSAGCAVGSGSGSVTGSIWLNQCTWDSSLGSQAAPSAFDLSPSYFIATPITDLMHPEMQNRLSIRIQSTGNQIEESNGVFIDIADVAPVASALATPIPVGPDTNIRATLNLWQTCPQISVQLECDGTITFSKFGVLSPGAPAGFTIQEGDELTATFSFDIVDRRAITLGGVGAVSAAPDAGGHIDGNFDFIVRQSRATQPY